MSSQNHLTIILVSLTLLFVFNVSTATAATLEIDDTNSSSSLFMDTMLIGNGRSDYKTIQIDELEYEEELSTNVWDHGGMATLTAITSIDSAVYDNISYAGFWHQIIAALAVPSGSASLSNTVIVQGNIRLKILQNSPNENIEKPLILSFSLFPSSNMDVFDCMPTVNINYKCRIDPLMKKQYECTATSFPPVIEENTETFNDDEFVQCHIGDDITISYETNYSSFISESAIDSGTTSFDCGLIFYLSSVDIALLDKEYLFKNNLLQNLYFPDMNPDSLGNGAVRGAASDGTTQLIIRLDMDTILNDSFQGDINSENPQIIRLTVLSEDGKDNGYLIGENQDDDNDNYDDTPRIVNDIYTQTWCAPALFDSVLGLDNKEKSRLIPIEVEIDTNNDGIYDSNFIENIELIRPPVILVHGWRPALNGPKTAVATWDSLRPKLQEAGYECNEFSYGLSGGVFKADGNPVKYAYQLQRFMDDIIADSNYASKFDIICHSMGAMVSRYYMENLGGADKIRLWIGIAPVNRGAAILDNPIVELFRFAVPGILRIFFPNMTMKDPAIEYMKPTSELIAILNNNGISPKVTHKVIVGWNGSAKKSFGGIHGKTYARKDDPDGHHHHYYYTNRGDGIVAMEQSKLPGSFGIDCVNDVNHNSILNSNETFARVLTYLTDPCTDSLNNWPQPQPDPCLDDLVPGTGNQGYLIGGPPQDFPFNVDSSVQKMTINADYQGSDIDLQIISPSQQILDPNAYPVVEYWKQDNAICYIIDLPTHGLWTAQLVPVDIPPEGEPYSLAVFFASPLVLSLTTAEGTYNYPPGASATIVAQLTDANDAITDATVTAQILRPDLSTDEVTLYDDATHGDFVANDGNCTNSYNLLTDGDYVVTVYATGTVAGNPFERMDIRTLYAALILDFNYDDIINFTDFRLLAAHWLDDDCHVPDWCEGTDLDHSEVVNFIDFAILAEHWLEGTTP